MGGAARTVELWMKTATTTHSNMFSYGKYPGFSAPSLHMVVDGSGTIDWGTGSSGTNLTTASTVVNDDQWHHIAFTYDGAEMKIYVDGVLDASRFAALNTQTNTNPMSAIIGANPPLNGGSVVDGFFDGQIDELRIWDYARTQAEIQADKDDELFGTESGLLRYYNFNQGIGGGNNASETTLNPQAGSASGTLNNFALAGGSSNWLGNGPGIVPIPPEPQFYVEIDTAGPGNTIVLPIGVNNFSGMATFQGSITFDPNVLTVSSVSSPNAEIAATATFGLPGQGNIPNNTITFAWYEQNLMSTNLADSTQIIEIAFDVNPAATTGFTAVEINGSTTPLGYSKDLGATNLLTPTVTNGGIEIDADPPTITCPSDITVNTDLGVCGAVVTFATPAGADNFPGHSVAQIAGPVSGSTFPVGTTAVTFEVTDMVGNTATCSFNVTVNDNEAPTVVTQNITVQLDANGNASITPGQIDDGSSDACGINSLSLDIDQFDCSDVGSPVTVTLTVDDVNGNSATGTAIVTVEDNVDPNVVTQNITVQLDANGDASITPAMIDNGSSDACGINTLSLDIDQFDCSDVGSPVTVTLTATDVNGNSATNTAVVTVEDNIDPIATCAEYHHCT